MEIRITVQHMHVGEETKQHVHEKITKLERLSPKLVEAHVILKKEKHVMKAEITVLNKNLRAFGEGQDKDNLYAAIDLAYTRVEKQLKKFREKVKSHHKGLPDEAIPPKVAVAEAINETLKPTGDERPSIVRTEEFARKPMSAEEASMQLEIEKNPFIVFSNAATKKVNVIYKRGDGNHGLIEPEF